MNDLKKQVLPIEGELLPIGLNFRFELSLQQSIDDFKMGDNAPTVLTLIDQLKNFTNLAGSKILLTGEKYSCYQLITRACYELVKRTNILADNELAFVDMSEFMVEHYPYELIELASRKFLVINNIDLVIGYNDWESWFFDLIQKLLISQSVCIFSCSGKITDFNYSIPDLQSRLEMFQQYHLVNYEHAHYYQVLESRASAQGLELKPEVLEHLTKIFLQRDNLDIDRSLFKLMKICADNSAFPKRIGVSFINKHLNEMLVFARHTHEPILRDDWS